MKILLSPFVLLPGNKSGLTIVVSGDLLTLNGESFDFGQLPDGASLPLEAIASEHFAGPVSRIEGELHLTLRFPIGPDASEAARFPSPIHVTTDGPVELPA